MDKKIEGTILIDFGYQQSHPRPNDRGRYAFVTHDPYVIVGVDWDGRISYASDSRERGKHAYWFAGELV